MVGILLGIMFLLLALNFPMLIPMIVAPLVIMLLYMPNVDTMLAIQQLIAGDAWKSGIACDGKSSRYKWARWANVGSGLLLELIDLPLHIHLFVQIWCQWRENIICVNFLLDIKRRRLVNLALGKPDPSTWTVAADQILFNWSGLSINDLQIEAWRWYSLEYIRGKL